MRVLIVSGIWPPDVGGPASHAPQVAEFLLERGHYVRVVVTADAAPAPRPYPVRYTPRSLPPGLRHLHAAALAAAEARRCDVVYTTGMFTRSAAAALVARRPYVVKLTGDPAFERLRWRGAVSGDVDEFQRSAGGLQARGLAALRNATLRRAAFVYCPSAYLVELAASWGVPRERLDVLPNPAPVVTPSHSRAALREELALTRLTFAFAGRLTAQKALPVALAALARVPDVDLVVAGDGPERAAVEAGIAEHGLEHRVRLLGPLPRERVLDLFHAADAALLSSAWENFPHTVVEALAAGAPVVATSVGGVAEVVRDGENGLLVPPGDPEALAAAMRRFAGDEALRERLRAAAAASIAGYAPGRLLARLEETLARVARA